MKPRRGFTLIELLMVMAIIGLLVSLYLPASRVIRESVNRARCAGKLKALAAAYQAYVSSLHGFPPVWHTSEYHGFVGGHDTHATWFPTTHTYCIFVEYQRFDVGFGPLVFHGYVNDMSTFVCPLMEDAGEPWWHQGATPGSVYLNIPQTNPNPQDLLQEWYKTPGHRLSTYGSYSSYAIRPGLYPHGMETLTARGVRAFMADLCHYPDVVLTRHVSGVNVCYLDGSVMFHEAPILIDNAYTTGGYYPLGANLLENTEYGRIWKALDQKE